MSLYRLKSRIKDIEYTGKGCLYVLFSPFILFFYICKWMFLLLKNGVLFFWYIIKLLFTPFKWIAGAVKKEGRPATSMPTADVERSGIQTESPIQPPQTNSPPANGSIQMKENIPMINLVKLECPNCGASLEVDSSIRQCFCTYCGTKLLIDNPNEKRIVDEAAVARERTKQLQLELDLEKNKAHIEAVKTKFEEQKQKQLAKEEAVRKKQEQERIQNARANKMLLPLLFTIAALILIPYSAEHGEIAVLMITVFQLVVLWTGFVIMDKTDKKYLPLGILCFAIGVLLVFPQIYLLAL